jgi:hypothetical protein
MVETAGGADGNAVAALEASHLPARDKAGKPAFLKTNNLRRTNGGADAVFVTALAIDLK